MKCNALKSLFSQAGCAINRLNHFVWQIHTIQRKMLHQECYQYFILGNFLPEVNKKGMDRVFQLIPCDPIIFRLTPLSHYVCVEVIGGGTKNLG